jgi:hypothetical protein
MAMSDRAGGPTNVRSLDDAVRKVRIAEADRSDVVLDLQEAEKARLDILAEELRSVFAEIPNDNETFIFKVATGAQPRLWIDMTAFVMVARDRRTYRFLKDTRLGRTVIVESASVDDVADTVTNYVAERIIERERAMEGDWLIKRAMRDQSKRGNKAAAEVLAAAHGEPRRRGLDRAALGWIIAALLGGILIGAIVLLAIAWFRGPA